LETFNTLLFELSSVDRLNIMLLLEKTPLKLSHISSKLCLTVQETSRNVERLAEAKLVAKDVDGLFHLTPYGVETLSQLSGFRFLFKNREYFTTHRTNELPRLFESSLGMLENCEPVKDVMIAFRNVEEMIAKAEEQVWILTNQILASTIPYLVSALERGAEFRLTMQKDYNPTKSIRDLVSNPAFEKAARNRKMDFRFLDKVPIFICLSEKEVSALAFPDINAKLDYIGFKSERNEILEWSKGLYDFYWDKASKQIPDQLTHLNPTC
jgi:predicted transcriptional regulator